MQDLKAALENVKRLSAQFRPLIELGEALNKLESLEQAERDAVMKKENTYKELAHAENLLKEEQLKIEQSSEVVDRNMTEARRMLVEADKESQRIIAQTKVVADDLMKCAEEECVKKEKELDDKKSELENVERQIRVAGERLVALQLQVDEVKNKLNSFIKS